MHVREGLQDSPAFIFGPHHEGIHGSLYVATGGGGPSASEAAWDRDRQATCGIKIHTVLKVLDVLHLLHTFQTEHYCSLRKREVQTNDPLLG